ncbi:MAG: glycosyltransferase [Bacillota bacterium]
MAGPLVSIVIPTYNHARYLGEAVDSVLKQDYRNIEVLVVNDGSTDDTEKVLKPFAQRIRYFYKERGGTSSALNMGIKKSRGIYLCWLSADDLFRKDKVSLQVGQLEQYRTLGFVYSSFNVIDAEGNIINRVHSEYYRSHKKMVQELLKGCFINGSTVMMRKSALDKVGGFDETLPQAHDYDMWYRLLCHYSCGFSDELLVSYRWHGENLSRHRDYKSEFRVKERAKCMFPEYFLEA